MMIRNCHHGFQNTEHLDRLDLIQNGAMNTLIRAGAPFPFALSMMGKIKIAGTLLGAVRSKVNLVHDKLGDVKYIREKSKWCRMLYHLILSQYHTGESPPTTWARTIILDDLRDGLAKNLNKYMLNSTDTRELWENYETQCLADNEDVFVKYQAWLGSDSEMITDFEDCLTTPENKAAWIYHCRLRVISQRRHLIITQNDPGYIGLAPEMTLPGDFVAIINGASTLFILRTGQVSGPYCFKIVGPCYLHGLMHGEIEELRACHKNEVWIPLV
jgi:hypothetical protein